MMAVLTRGDVSAAGLVVLAGAAAVPGPGRLPPAAQAPTVLTADQTRASDAWCSGPDGGGRSRLRTGRSRCEFCFVF